MKSIQNTQQITRCSKLELPMLLAYGGNLNAEKYCVDIEIKCIKK